MATTTTRPAAKERAAQPSRLETARGAVTDAVGDAAAVAGLVVNEATTRLPPAASTTLAAFDDANRRIHASSDEMLRLGTAVAFGAVAGMLIAGANRILVAMALVPLTMFGLTMLERSSAANRTGDRASVPGGL